MLESACIRIQYSGIFQAQSRTTESFKLAAEKGVYTLEMSQRAVLGPFSFSGEQQQTILIIPTIYHVRHQNGDLLKIFLSLKNNKSMTC